MTGRLSVQVLAMMFERDRSRGVRVVGCVLAADPRNPSHREMTMSVGDNVEPTVLDLPAGRYTVEVTLPSGRMLSDDVTVESDSTTELRLGAQDSPYETHSLQHLLCNIEPGPVFRSSASYAVPASRGARSFAQRRRPPEAATTGAGPGMPRSAPPSGPSLSRPPSLSPPLPPPAPPPIPAPDARVSLLSRAPDTRLTFPELNALAVRPPAEAAEEVGRSLGAPPGATVEPEVHDPVAPLYRLGPHGIGTTLSAPGPHYLTVTAAGDTYLVTLPLPWTDTHGQDTTAEVLVNLRQGPTASAASVAVADPAVGAGLSYMAAGYLDKAAVLFRDVREMLLGKVANPLAAAAAGYVLIGTDTASDRQDWDPYLENLHDWFPTLSDGAILCGTRRLRTARTEAEMEHGRDDLLEGYHRGLPVYTLGLTWLIDGLSMFPEHPDCAAALTEVRRLAFRANMREPFIVLRLGEDPP